MWQLDFDSLPEERRHSWAGLLELRRRQVEGRPSRCVGTLAPLFSLSYLCLLSCQTRKGQIALTGAGEGPSCDRAGVACYCGCNAFILEILGAFWLVSFITELLRTK